MGCGSSKEEKNAASAGTAEDKPQPIRKIRTNFSDIHYDEPAHGRLEPTYAPSEIPESRRPTEADPVSGPGVPTIAEGMLSPGSEDPASSPLVPERKKSWIERMSDKRTGRDTRIPDEQLKSVLGMDRKELEEWGKDKPVGPRQESRMAGYHQGEGMVPG